MRRGSLLNSSFFPNIFVPFFESTKGKILIFGNIKHSLDAERYSDTSQVSVGIAAFENNE